MEVCFSGQSMLPTIREGDKLSIELFPEPCSVENVSPGEIVLFREGQEWVTHRVVQLKGKKYTKGDWSYSIDPQVPLWGKVTAINGSQKKLSRNSIVAQLSALDLLHSNSVMRRVRKVVSILIDKL